MREPTDGAGRPKGSKTYDPKPAKAFGAALVAIRLEQSKSQDDICAGARIEQSHLSKIENGKHMPNLALILRIAHALDISAADLLAATEDRLNSIDEGEIAGSPKVPRPRRPRAR